jgi:hypothetical protein
MGMYFYSSPRSNNYETVYVTVDKMLMKRWRLTRVWNALWNGAKLHRLIYPPEPAINKIEKIGYVTYMKRGMKRKHLMDTYMFAPGVSYLLNTWRFIHVSYAFHTWRHTHATFHTRFIPDGRPFHMRFIPGFHTRFIHVSYTFHMRFIPCDFNMWSMLQTVLGCSWGCSWGCCCCRSGRGGMKRCIPMPTPSPRGTNTSVSYYETVWNEQDQISHSILKVWCWTSYRPYSRPTSIISTWVCTVSNTLCMQKLMVWTIIWNAIWNVLWNGESAWVWNAIRNKHREQP